MNIQLRPLQEHEKENFIRNIQIAFKKAVIDRWGDDGEEIWYTETAERQKTIPFFKLLHETLADFGFIDRYPAGKEDITGMPCLPYLIRFVGSSEVAHAIMDNGLCLEEYVAANTEK